MRQWIKHEDTGLYDADEFQKILTSVMSTSRYSLPVLAEALDVLEEDLKSWAHGQNLPSPAYVSRVLIEMGLMGIKFSSFQNRIG